MNPLEIPLDEFDWGRASRRFVASPFANTLLSEGADFFERRVHSVPARVDHVARNMVFGTDEAILTIMGKERNKSNQGARGLKEAYGIMEEYERLIQGQDALKFWHKKAVGGFKETRARFDPIETAKRTATYHPDYPDLPKPDPAAIAAVYPFMVQVWDELGTELTNFDGADIGEFEKWFTQMPKNKNSGWPQNLPASAERIRNVDWPSHSGTIKRMLAGMDEIDIDLVLSKPPVGNANMPVYMMGGRSPDRLIFMTRLFKKLYGAFLNYNVVNGLKGKTFIAWDDVWNINIKTQAAFSKGATSQFCNDFKGFDTGFTEPIMVLLRDTFRESQFAINNHALRRAIDIALTEMCHESTLQMWSTHAMRLRPGLWSGVDVTQLVGSVMHASGSRWIDDEVNLGVVNEDYLSDDMKLESDKSKAEIQKDLDGPWTSMWNSLGFTIHPEKTAIADLDSHWEAGVRNGDAVTYTDTGIFLQYHFGPGFMYGNHGRRLKSLYEKERDTSDAAMRESIKPYVGSLKGVRSGGKPQEYFFDLYRSASILETVGTDFPLIDDIDQWFVNTWPSFDRRWSKMSNSVDDRLWDVETQSWGGQTGSGLNTRKVAGRWDSWIDGTYEPIWD